MSELECFRCGRLIETGETYFAVDYKTERRETAEDSLLLDHPTLAASFCDGCGPGVQMIRQAMRNLPGRRE